MARIVDITDKLTFEGNPLLRIREVDIEVNSDAPTMLKLMSVMNKSESENERILEAYNLIFPEESREKLIEMKLSFSDLVKVIESAVDLIQGGAQDPQGEAQTHTMTYSKTTI